MSGKNDVIMTPVKNPYLNVSVVEHFINMFYEASKLYPDSITVLLKMSKMVMKSCHNEDQEVRLGKKIKEMESNQQGE